jgi:O-antigen biosynthesis protein
MQRGSLGYFNRGIAVQNLSAVTAACLVIRRSIYEEVGGLNEELAVAFNDVDFCLRVRAAGYRNVWTPFAELYHHESATRGSDMSSDKYERFLKEVRWMEERWAGSFERDPAYNPNLTLSVQVFPFELADPPRIGMLD